MDKDILELRIMKRLRDTVIKSFDEGNINAVWERIKRGEPFPVSWRKALGNEFEYNDN